MTTGARTQVDSPVLSNGNGALARSREFCEQLTRIEARNFYYGLRLLPMPKRRSMFALYAYMRLVDDIADEEDGRTAAQRQDHLEHWRSETHAVLAGAIPGPSTNGNGTASAKFRGREIWPAFAEMASLHQLPPRIFDDVIKGQRQDLHPVAFAGFDQLYEYCYQVAGTVGLASIYIWGFAGGEETELLAVQRGLAFQLTNILRDLREDAARGRTYLPADELAAAGVTPADLQAGQGGERFAQLMRQQIARADSFYEKSSALEDRIDAESRPTLIAMTEILPPSSAKNQRRPPTRPPRARVIVALLETQHRLAVMRGR